MSAKQPYMHPTALTVIVLSPGLKSDILRGKTGHTGRNLPHHRISCSRLPAVLKGHNIPFFAHACLNSILHIRKKCKRFFSKNYKNFFAHKIWWKWKTPDTRRGKLVYIILIINGAAPCLPLWGRIVMRRQAPVIPRPALINSPTALRRSPLGEGAAQASLSEGGGSAGAGGSYAFRTFPASP